MVATPGTRTAGTVATRMAVRLVPRPAVLAGRLPGLVGPVALAALPLPRPLALPATPRVPRAVAAPVPPAPTRRATRLAATRAMAAVRAVTVPVAAARASPSRR